MRSAGPPIRPIAVTMGDPAGIGAELAVKTWIARDGATPPFLLIADPTLLAQWAPVRMIDDPCMALAVFDQALPILPVKLAVPALPGQPDPRNGAAVIQAIRLAVTLAQAGEVAAIVTNPIHKAGLYAAGFDYPGHTEFLGDLTKSPRPVMMLAVEGLRVVPLTIHLALTEVPKALTQELIRDCATIVDQAMRRDFGLAHPRLVIAGLNPHAGEEGMIGREEVEVIKPAIDLLAARGLQVAGPFPADSLFHEQARARYDVALCPTHDQALIPLKTIDFFGGVNVTLGLPIIRTSPDHGTAFDIAGRGLAHTGSFKAALAMARTMADHRARSVEAA